LLRFSSKNPNKVTVLILGNEDKCGRVSRPYYNPKSSEIDMQLFDLAYCSSYARENMMNENDEEENLEFIASKSSYSIVDVDLCCVNETFDDDFSLKNTSVLDILTDDYQRRSKSHHRFKKLYFITITPKNVFYMKFFKKPKIGRTNRGKFTNFQRSLGQY